ncbi:uncharacterized protein LOC128239225 [Mya arenaria]|uniref:uncharacterized protein LOC128239225 n=1 Tax=Mya arenaria TaxID=6604 RepID=UPI0022DF3D9A|nr:uncharacterized protein LOC128239225 [Mya arenaria]XP_052811741.1 uncharacterized protein LOC128239225 [Mya arenaria]
MDISETPMCGDHPSVHGEAVCMKHRQIICMKCVLEDKKHSRKKCEVRVIKNMETTGERNLVALLALKFGITLKKTKLESHMENTDVEKQNLKRKVEKYFYKLQEELQKKFESSLKSIDDKVTVIQNTNRSRMESIDSSIAMFDTEIERMLNKKGSKVDDGSDMFSLRQNVKNLPFTDVHTSSGFHVDTTLKQAVYGNNPYLGQILIDEDDEQYEGLQEDNEYLTPVTSKLITTPGKDTDDTLGQTNYDTLENTGKEHGPYTTLAKQAGKPKISSTTTNQVTPKKLSAGRFREPLPAVPTEKSEEQNYEKYESMSKKAAVTKGSSTPEVKPNKQPVVKLPERQKSLPNFSPASPKTTPENPYFNLKLQSAKKEQPCDRPKPNPVEVKVNVTQGQSNSEKESKSTIGRGSEKRVVARSSLLDKFPALKAKAEGTDIIHKHKSSSVLDLKNTSSTLSTKDIKRTIVNINLLSTNRVVLLDVRNSAIILAGTDGHVISEPKGSHYISMVGNDRGKVAVLGRGTKLHLTIYMAIAEQIEVQTSTDIQCDIVDVIGFDFNDDAREYAVSGNGKLVIVMETGKTKHSLSFAACMTGKEKAADLKTSYDFEMNCMFILDTSLQSLKRFDIAANKKKWEVKIENGNLGPVALFNGTKALYILFKDGIKIVNKASGAVGKLVKTSNVVGEARGLYVDEKKNIAMISSDSQDEEKSNTFGIVAL